MRFQITWANHRQETNVDELVAGGLRRLFGLQDVANRNVDTISLEVDYRRGRRNTGIDVRVGREKAIEPGCEPFGRESRRRTDHQDVVVANAVETGNRLAQLTEAGVQSWIERTPGIGELDRARLAHEQFSHPGTLPAL